MAGLGLRLGDLAPEAVTVASCQSTLLEKTTEILLRARKSRVHGDREPGRRAAS